MQEEIYVLMDINEHTAMEMYEEATAEGSTLTWILYSNNFGRSGSIQLALLKELTQIGNYS